MATVMQHFPPEIKIMIIMEASAVLCLTKVPGGTQIATHPT